MMTTYRMYKGRERELEFPSRSRCHITPESAGKAARSFEAMWSAI
ncbi:hypothetical protein SAMN05192552_10864 [Natrinema hispanicum]|uniref:Uncharacterized protein n=1 Tax=Natrinema hispanicum TaxID=392421 RepID=A0A1I0JRR3_9EURY|nr:hypothetical protein SAMN05192552_10864 [Natrinema hispanicum]SEU13342.1 hypothetical protein SAMN04488694_1587 [Natrinema hispanicum]